MKAIKLIMVTEKNNNKYYNMTEIENTDSFEVEYGRVDVTSTKKVFPMRDWDKKLKSKLKKGYEDKTHLFLEKTTQNDTKLNEIPEKIIAQLIEELQNFANKQIATNYKVSANSVTQKQIDEAQKLIDELSSIVGKRKKLNEEKIQSFNKTLLELFKVIPRKMKKVALELVTYDNHDSKELREIINLKLNDEQSLLDTMAGQVQLNTNKKEESSKTDLTILDVMGIKIDIASPRDIKIIKNNLGEIKNKFKAGYKVINIKTQKIFDLNIKNSNNQTTNLFWHGSRNENWFNILQTGLLIRPSGAIHTGSMFGDGIYFASKARKSLGYSSLRGSYWSGGNANKGFMALYDVHVGKQKHIYKHDRGCYTITHKKLQKENNYDSIFAHGGVDLCNDEFIVYKSNQSTIKYLVEFK